MMPSTNALMLSFYKNLNDGMAKDIALQNAKLDFISNRGHYDSDPFFWGGFVISGDVSPLPKGNWQAFLISSIFILVIVLWIFLRLRN